MRRPPAVIFSFCFMRLEFVSRQARAPRSKTRGSKNLDALKEFAGMQSLLLAFAPGLKIEEKSVRMGTTAPVRARPHGVVQIQMRTW
ncbi:MAG: hypothetical protein DMF61_08785 [Blastocatellia bacterium AA13]|nr:MAG: hypothetical protein DMF61_08785 [Blastocatellia bacterium AA13]